jgi:hypothetical protein
VHPLPVLILAVLTVACVGAGAEAIYYALNGHLTGAAVGTALLITGLIGGYLVWVPK